MDVSGSFCLSNGTNNLTLELEFHGPSSQSFLANILNILAPFLFHYPYLEKPKLYAFI